MKRAALVLILILAISSTAVARDSSQAVVKSFYKSYTESQEKEPRNWVASLLKAQKANMEPELYDLLVDIDDNKPGESEIWLDFDPFSNAQMTVKSYTVGAPAEKGGLAYVPVSFKYSRDTGPERMRVRVVLRKSGDDWKIANFVYPAEAGAKEWELKGWLKEGLKK